MLKKIKTTSFWVGLSGIMVVLIDSISGLIGITIASEKVGEIILSICSLLVLFGVVAKSSDDEETTTKELSDNLNDDDE